MALETILKTTGHGCILFLTETTFANSFKYSNRKKQTLFFFFLVHLPVYQGDRLNLYKFFSCEGKAAVLKKRTASWTRFAPNGNLFSSDLFGLLFWVKHSSEISSRVLQMNNFKTSYRCSRKLFFLITHTRHKCFGRKSSLN